MLTTKKVIVSSISLIAVTTAVSGYITQTNIASATEANTTFQVNVKDSLAVSIMTPTNWATGDVNTLLRNKVSVSVTSNSANGFTASMTTKTADTSLAHVADKGTIPTLAASSVKSAFPANYWGYSINDTDAGNDSSTYSALVGAGSTPITLISNAQSSTVNSRDIYFGAKADTTKASGTYVGTVVISVVTGTIEEDPTDPGYNPTTPENPANPVVTPETPIYSGTGTTTGGTTNGATTYTYSRTSGSTTTTTTQVSDGDNRNAYVGYTPPQGVTNRQSTTESVSEGSSLATGLAITSAVAATTGTIFFILAKRKKDDDEEEDEQQQF